MPYIKEIDRLKFAQGLNPPPKTPGELNYCITTLINAYRQEKGEYYHVFNDIVGALESAKCEFYRRVVIPYENIKIQENGDVY